MSREIFTPGVFISVDTTESIIPKTKFREILPGKAIVIQCLQHHLKRARVDNKS